MAKALFFVENLTPGTWLFSLWPRICWDHLRRRNRVIRCYIFDASSLSMLVARATAWLAGTAVEKLQFRLVDIKDESGALVGLRLLHQDMMEVQQEALAEPAYQELGRTGILQDRLPIFLAKSISSATYTEKDTLWRALMLVQVSVWKVKQVGNQDLSTYLVLSGRPWFNAISSYAQRNQVTLIPVRPAVSLQTKLRRRISPELVDRLRFFHYRRRQQGLLGSLRSLFSTDEAGEPAKPDELALPPEDGGEPWQPKVAVEYYGHLNLDQPELQSNLFFWQESPLKGQDILLAFQYPADPLDGRKLAELKEYGIEPVVLHPGATTLPDVPVFRPRPPDNQMPIEKVSVDSQQPERAWLNEKIADYQAIRDYWAKLFDAYGVKVYVTWNKNGGNHCAIANALQSVGGVTAIYQRSYESHPSPETTVGADIVFGFSPVVAEIERQSNSVIRYHVTTGYLGDHRFSLLQSKAKTVRNQLREQGAQRILCFADENSGDDSRWHTGHQFMRENYAFLLEKVLANPWLGLVIKPKTPQTLRQRLGPVAELLQEAEKTGRCYLFEGGVIQASHPPCVAGLAADLAIHGHLNSGTAGVEMALAGVPTLLLDREGWPSSPLHRLGKGLVAFTSWEDLWEACAQHWASPAGIPGFGDWSSMLDELDPFRDGRAAERMGTYIQWLMEGFQNGLDRERAMEEAAERYCAAWGADKVNEVNSGRVSQYAVTR